jgi:hypothetical protein
MTRYRITISGPNREIMLDLIRKHKIEVFDHSINWSEQTGYIVDALAEPAEIQKLEAAGYVVQTHEDADARGRERQNEVGRGNRYTQTKSE